MFQKINRKLMILISGLLAASLLIVSTITYQQTKHVIEDNVQSEASSLVQELNRYVDNYFGNFATTLDLFSQDERIIAFVDAVEEDPINREGWGAIDQTFAHFNDLNDSVQLSYIATNQSIDTTPLIDLPDDFDPTERPWYINAKENPDEVVWTQPYISDEDGEYVVTAAKAITEADQFLGVLAMDVSLEALATVINQVEVNYDGFLFLYDDQGVALVHQTLTGEDLSEEEAVQQMLTGEKNDVIHYHFDGQDRLMYYETVPQTNWKIGAVYVHDDMLASARDLSNLILLVAIAVILLSLTAAYFFSKGITRPIVQLKSEVGRVADGDLTVQVQTKAKDEVGDLAQHFNMMVANVNELIHSAQRSANQVNDSAENMSAVSEEMIASSEDVSQAVSEIAKGASQQASDVEDTRNRAVEFSNQIDKVTTETNTLMELSNQTKEQSKQGASQVVVLKEKNAESNEVIASVQSVIVDLSSKISEVESVISAINGISEQTNLLALNASIEAARAGEHGKGFAVVADEVRKLAEQSSDATVKVSETIKGIVSESERAIAAITKTQEISSEQTTAVSDTEKAFDRIATAIATFVDSIDSINHDLTIMNDHKDALVGSIQSIAAVTEQAAASVEEVNASTDQQVDALNSVAQAAEELNQLSSDLLKQSNSFKVRDE
ncbi:methyl-accepting chemotaxis protein [Desertibacillus haloalkaliphilus]|uniref:methyl-accepting chemotaxis protein n=1 Tax=Desertibacillus haloalkaliphilus TaxID=1328930 RepID=UPI001C26A6AD|nr:methyl-accepting chemotaxis protein [Desertibacillus haloalkaliphilus]MBU8907449.1 methyl-accepting chemotaxis protein [Desertibacillus haloalkaliphilus]